MLRKINIQSYSNKFRDISLAIGDRRSGRRVKYAKKLSVYSMQRVAEWMMFCQSLKSKVRNSFPKHKLEDSRSERRAKVAKIYFAFIYIMDILFLISYVADIFSEYKVNGKYCLFKHELGNRRHQRSKQP